MNEKAYEEKNRELEIAMLQFDKDWRDTTQRFCEEQEIVRRGIEALNTAKKMTLNMTGDDEKAVNKEIKDKLLIFVKALESKCPYPEAK
jgi:hypothetical protein